ncbi:MAG: hypothetical protein Q9223_004520 [Gallowayella weberi]
MARKTRQTSKLREAEGIPPSPPIELPTELSGTRRPRKKKAPPATQTLITSETDEGASSSSSSQHHQLVPDQPLREGNAGGYVHNSTSAESTREQQAFLTDTDRSPTSFASQGTATSRQTSGADEVAAPSKASLGSGHAGSTYTSPHTPSATSTSLASQGTATSRQPSGAEEVAAPSKASLGSRPAGSTCTSPHTPSATSVLFAQIANPQSSPPYLRTVHQGVTSPTRTIEPIASVQPVSTQTDGLAASATSPVADRTGLSRLQKTTSDTAVQTETSPQSSPNDLWRVWAEYQGVTSPTRTIEPTAAVQPVSTQTDGLTASATSPVADRTGLSGLQETPSGTAVVQTETHLQAFKPLSLYAYKSEVSVLPDFCSVTLHLDGGREIRISQASALAIRKISDILQRDPLSQYERNWLTSQEIEAAETEAEAEAEAEADAKAKAKAESERQQQSATKRKRNEDTEMPQAQRRRITPPPTPSANMTRRVRFMRANRGRYGRSLAAMRADPLGEEEAGPYNENGDLQLFRPTPSHTQDDDPFINNSIAGPSTQDIGTPDEASRGDEQSPPQNEDTSAPDTQDSGVGLAQINEEALQTPQTGSWRFGSLVKSVSRYVPGFRPQRRPLAAPQTGTPIARDHNQPAAQTEPQRSATMAGHSDFANRLQNSQTAANKIFRTKENIEAMKKVKAERERIKEEWANLAEEKMITEQEKLEIAETKRITEREKQDVAEAHRAAVANQLPGSKRKRTSPSVIPNPKGVSYGLDLDFFCYSDSSEDEEVEKLSPSRKIRRVSGPDHSSSKKRIANPQITPSAPALHTSPSGRAAEYNGSRFSDSPPNVFGQAAVPSRKVITKNDPGFNHSGHFKVPSPHSSDEDSDEEEEVATPVVDKAPPLPSSTTLQSTGNDSDHAAPASSLRKSATESMIPPVTPAPKQVVTAPEARRDPEAAKTLERNRQMLRAKIAGKNKSVLSPKDIQGPSKVQVPSQAAMQPTPQLTNDDIFFRPQQTNTGAPTQPTPQLTNDAISFQPQQTSTGAPVAQAKDDGLSILGAASRKAPKSPARMLAETLPSIGDKLDKLQSFNDYQQAMDPRARESLELSWKEADETTAGNHFSSSFKEFSDAQKQDSAELAKSQSWDFRQASDDEATDDEDHASLYEDENDNTHKGQDINDLFEETNEDEEALTEESEEDSSATPPLTALPTAFRDYSMDPAVATYLKEQWTAEDEAYAGDEFKTQLERTF